MCPALGWLAAVFGAHGEGGVAKFAFLLIGLPALLSVAGAAAARTRTLAVIPVAVVSGALGAVTWVLTIVWLATHGVFD